MRLNAMYQIMDHKLIDIAAASPKASRTPAKTQETGRSGFESTMRKTRQTVHKQADQSASKDTAKPVSTSAAPAEETAGSAERQAIAAALMYQAQPMFRPMELPVVNVNLSVPELEVSGEQLSQMTEVSDASAQVDLLTAVQPENEAQTAGLNELLRGVVQEQLPNTDTVSAQTIQHTAETMPEQVVVTQAAESEQTTDVRDEQSESDADFAAAQGTPLFGEVQAAPVRVAAPEEAPIPVETQAGMERLASQIETIAAGEAGFERVELTLEPEHLGKLVVEITRSDSGALHIVLSATTSRAAALLGQNTGNLQHLLMNQNRPEVQIQVRGGEEAQQQFLNPNGQNPQEQHRQQQHRQEQRRQHTQDFMQQLRLGLVTIPEPVDAV